MMKHTIKRKNGEFLIPTLILLAVCIFGQSSQAQTSIYIFDPNQSTILQTGGIAGVNWTYTVEGRFQLSVDFDAGTASFEKVDANAVDDSPYKRTLDPNEVFAMNTLIGTAISETTLEFAGLAADGSDIRISATVQEDLVHLAAETTPPPNSADFFIFSMDAVAQRKYGGGTGEPNHPYQIATAQDLILLGDTPEDYDKQFILTADIDLDPNLPERKVFDRAVIAPDTNDMEDGFQGTPFCGTFDGDGHVIRNLSINGMSYLGLFGRFGQILYCRPPAEMANLRVEAVNIVGAGDCVGSLIGVNNAVSVHSCHSTGMVIGNEQVGGLVGEHRLGRIVACSSTSEVTGEMSVGGLVGYSQGGSVRQCCSAGAVTGKTRVGGLVGHNGNDNSTSGGLGRDPYVEDCYSTCIVTGRGVEHVDEYVLHGFMVGIGGLVGFNGGYVYDSYSTGSVGGSGLDIGGLVGREGEWSGFVERSFWDTQTSGQTTSNGGTGKTTAEMQTAGTFLEAGWDFVGETTNGTEDIWSICEGTNYPRLLWQIPPGDFVCPDGITIEDFVYFIEHWEEENCEKSNDYCSGADLDFSGTVDTNDLEILVENWLAGVDN